MKHNTYRNIMNSAGLTILALNMINHHITNDLTPLLILFIPFFFIAFLYGFIGYVRTYKKRG